MSKPILAALLSASLALGLGGPALAQVPQDPSQSVLVILAHPDDELPMAPALAALARAGAQVQLVYATRGDAGPGVSDYAPGEALAAARSEEARCAARALGLPEPVLLGFGDGKLAEQARSNPDGKGPLPRLAEEIAAHAPDTIITWGPDGGYGHADHRLVSAFATQMVQAMPAPARPDLLYFGIRSDREIPLEEFATWARTDPSLLTVRIHFTRDDFLAANEAAKCHVTQFPSDTRNMLAGVFAQLIWKGAVDFRPALPPAGAE